MKPLPPATRLYRILIVDDNEAAAQGIGKLLSYRGHTVKLLHRGIDVVEGARNYDPEIIILDIGLPDINGYEIARQLRGEANSKAFIIALTGYGQYEDREEAREAGFDRHLTKPVGLREIEEVITQAEKDGL